MGTIHLALLYVAMDDLLKRADRAIDESCRVREQAIEHLMRLRRVASQVRETVARAHSARSRYCQPVLETADRQGFSQGNPAGS